MYQYVFVLALISCVCASAAAQTGTTALERSFELTPVAPPRPALKYQLTYDDLADTLPGNAAILYLDAVLLMGPDARQKVDQALAADTNGDTKAFNALADELDLSSVMQELELGARRVECDWQPPYREMGAYTLLPHLEPLAKGIARMLWIRGQREINQGEINDALRTLRVGYELSNDVGREPMVVSGLVSLSIFGQMNDCVADLMSRPDAPNLYWALSEIAPRKPIHRRAMDGERAWVVTSVPSLMKLRNGENLSADQWRELFDEVWKIVESSPGDGIKRPDPLDRATPELLQLVRQAYAEAHSMTADEVAKLESIVVLGDFYYRQYQQQVDDQFKLRGLPYPILLPMTREHAAHAAKLREAQPENPFQVFGMDKVVEGFARADRELAALTAVEAIRSYAAANGGKLPAKLDDVTETPVPENPATGEPFEYRLEGSTATLQDTKFEPRLEYTVKVRN